MTASVRRIKSRAQADQYIQALIIPLVERVGLKVSVKHSDKAFTLKIGLPDA